MQTQNVYGAEEFRGYRPRKFTILKKDALVRLTEYMRTIQDDSYLIIFLWRFVFKMDEKVISKYSNEDNINGIVESFRFSCQRYLDISESIADESMGKALSVLLDDYEIILLSREQGITWARMIRIGDAYTFKDAIEEAQKKYYKMLNDRTVKPNQYKDLDEKRIKVLAHHIAELPVEEADILVLRFVHNHTYADIEQKLGTEYARGVTEHLRMKLSRKLRVSKPINNDSLKRACMMSVEFLREEKYCRKYLSSYIELYNDPSDSEQRTAAK